MKNPDVARVETATAPDKNKETKEPATAKAPSVDGGAVRAAASPTPAPASASAAEPKMSAQGAQALMSMFSGMMGNGESATPPGPAPREESLSAPPPAPTPEPSPVPTAAAGTGRREIVSAAPVRRQTAASSKVGKRPIELSEESFSSGRTPAPSGQRATAAAKAGGIGADSIDAVIVKPPAPGASPQAKTAAAGGGGVVELTGATFDTFVSGGGTVVVDFWAPWCGPCVKMAPVVEGVAGEYGGAVRFGKIDVDEYRAIAGRFKIEALPTLVMFKGGTARERSVGSLDAAQLKKWVDASR